MAGVGSTRRGFHVHGHGQNLAAAGAGAVVGEDDPLAGGVEVHIGFQAVILFLQVEEALGR